MSSAEFLLADAVTLLCAAMDRAREEAAHAAVMRMLGEDEKETSDGD